MPYQRISHGEPARHIVDASPTPQVYDEEKELEKERKWAKKLLESKKVYVTERGKGNDELEKDELQRLKKEHQIPYREEKCPYCHVDVIYRESDEIYSPTRGTEKSVVKTQSWPINVPISLETPVNRWGNYENEITGEAIMHECQLESMSKEDLLKYISNMNHENILFQRQITNDLLLLRKQAVLRPVYFE